MKINFLNRQQVDEARWNACMDASVNGMIYGYSWYLDIVSPGWCALADEDYHYIFPLPRLKRNFNEIIIQPLYTQQLGLFSDSHLSPEILDEFISAIPSRYRYIGINLNTLNRTERYADNTSARVTYRLDLFSSYENIQKKYCQNTRRNNLKAYALGCRVERSITPAEFLGFYSKYGVPRQRMRHYVKVRQLVESLMKRDRGELVGVYTPGSQLCAVSLICKSNGKLIYLLAASSPLGRQNRAMFALVDQVIRWYSETELVFDFEGSMIPSIARFYGGFGATPCSYSSITINHLPLYARFLFIAENGIRTLARKVL